MRQPMWIFRMTMVYLWETGVGTIQEAGAPWSGVDQPRSSPSSTAPSSQWDMPSAGYSLEFSLQVTINQHSGETCRTDWHIWMIYMYVYSNAQNPRSCIASSPGHSQLKQGGPEWYVQSLHVSSTIYFLRHSFRTKMFPLWVKVSVIYSNLVWCPSVVVCSEGRVYTTVRRDCTSTTLFILHTRYKGGRLQQ